MMRLLITNDDGIDAPGLAALERVARRLAGSVVVVAPKLPHSGCGHRVTTDRPLVVERLSDDRHAVDGTPADCVRVAVARLATDADIVLSGVNAGGNLGVDVHHSGTVAAAREAAFHGRRAVALSHYHRRGLPIDWRRAESWLEGLLPDLLGREHAAGEWWNVNLPHLDDPTAMPPVVECPIDPSPMQLAYRPTDEGLRYASAYHERPRRPGHDIEHCFGGAITVSRGRSV